MKIPKSMCVCALLSLTLPSTLSGLEKQPDETGNSCREFVAGFYSWYAAMAAREPQEHAGDVALKNRAYLFSPAIVQAVRKGNEVQDKAGSDLVSLDGDPFAGGDGVAQSYIVERATLKNGRCWAEVHGVWEGKEDKAADVSPELTMKDGRWLFVNFYFPGASGSKNWNLLSALKALRDGEKQGKSGKSQKP